VIEGFAFVYGPGPMINSMGLPRTDPVPAVASVIVPAVRSTPQWVVFVWLVGDDHTSGSDIYERARPSSRQTGRHRGIAQRYFYVANFLTRRPRVCLQARKGHNERICARCNRRRRAFWPVSACARGCEGHYRRLSGACDKQWTPSDGAGKNQ